MTQADGLKRHRECRMHPDWEGGRELGKERMVVGVAEPWPLLRRDARFQRAGRSRLHSPPPPSATLELLANKKKWDESLVCASHHHVLGWAPQCFLSGIRAMCIHQKREPWLSALPPPRKVLQVRKGASEGILATRGEHSSLWFC